MRNTPTIQGLLRTSACYGIYGEHDFGTAGANEDFVYAPESQSAFQRYWPNPSWGTPANPGCYCSFSMGDAWGAASSAMRWPGWSVGTGRILRQDALGVGMDEG